MEVSDIPPLMFIGAILALGGYATFKSMSADGRIDYCYVETHGISHQELALKAHVPWRGDRHIGTFPNIDAAAETAKKYGCELK